MVYYSAHYQELIWLAVCAAAAIGCGLGIIAARCILWAYRTLRVELGAWWGAKRYQHKSRELTIDRVIREHRETEELRKAIGEVNGEGEWGLILDVFRKDGNPVT